MSKWQKRTSWLIYRVYRLQFDKQLNIKQTYRQNRVEFKCKSLHLITKLFTYKTIRNSNKGNLTKKSDLFWVKRTKNWFTWAKETL